MSPASTPQPPLAEAAPLFAALGDGTRLAIAARLAAAGPLSVTALTRESTVTRQAIAKHLNVLAAAGLVHGQRRGREHFWEFDGQRLDDARRYLDAISTHWDGVLGRLKALVEE